VPEEKIHGAEEDACAPFAKSGGGLAEVGEEPVGAGLRGGGEPEDDLRELLRGEAVEEEMGDDEVEPRAGKLAFADVGMDEFDRAAVQAVRAEAVAGDGGHACAGVHAGAVGVGMGAEDFDEAATVPLACEEDAARGRNSAKEGGAAALKFAPREHGFHPAVMGREAIELRGTHQTVGKTDYVELMPPSFQPG